MSRYKLHIGYYVISISGFAHDQPVWSRRQLKVHKGPTIELTIVFPQDPPSRFNIPFPVTRDMLSKLVGRHGGILWPKQLKLLHDRIDELASDVFDHHSWYRPYRPFSEGFEDCVALAWPVTGKGSVGAVDAEEYVKSWFP
jgi:hypothetical protein